MRRSPHSGFGNWYDASRLLDRSGRADQFGSRAARLDAFAASLGVQMLVLMLSWLAGHNGR
jgi:hypothetical protein